MEAGGEIGRESERSGRRREQETETQVEGKEVIKADKEEGKEKRTWILNRKSRMKRKKEGNNDRHEQRRA